MSLTSYFHGVAATPGLTVPGKTADGIKVCSIKNAIPDEDGVFFRLRIKVPSFRRACYYAPFQKYAIDPSLDLWPEGYNQCHPLPVVDFCNAKRGGIFTLIELEDGNYLALLPIVTAGGMAWLRGDEDGLVVEVGHWGASMGEGKIPVLAWSKRKNPYEACESVWRLAVTHPSVNYSTRLRSEKSFPEPFSYLGWCSWEEFKWDIRADFLEDIFEKIDRSPVPVRWTIIDDGHINEGAPVANGGGVQNGETPLHESERRLWGLEPRRDSFPDGWDFLRRIRERTKLRWFGIWLNFNGYWGGIHADNGLGEVNAVLQEVRPGVLQPKPEREAARLFYSTLIEEQRCAGFDFVKVDNQAKNVTFYRDAVPNAVQATMFNHAALEEAVASKMSGMINCMAHNNLCSFSTKNSQITRCSEDYKKGNLWRAKHHLHNSFSNMLWLGQTVWGDHDMFHSSDLVAGEVMARSKAISGGPIYLSDNPVDFNVSLIRSLCFESGKLLMPLAPAVPLPESVFLDPYKSPRAYRVIAPLPHNCAAIAAYNLTHPTRRVDGHIAMEDYQSAGALLQDGRPEWAVPREGLLAYDIKSKEIHLLNEGRLEFALNEFGDAFFIMVPIREGIAVIGRQDKILPPAGVKSIEKIEGGVKIDLPESGPILIWSRRKLWCDQASAETISNGVWCFHFPISAEPMQVAIYSDETN